MAKPPLRALTFDPLRRWSLVHALRRPTPEMTGDLEALRQEGSRLRTRTDLLWFLLLRSHCTQGRSAGWAWFQRDAERQHLLGYEALAALAPDQRMARLRATLRQAAVRMPDIKADRLFSNFDAIAAMGGVEAATRRMLSLAGKEAKYEFLTGFAGIGPKYGRNIWMDLHDADFHDAVAIDERIKNVSEAIRLTGGRYTEQEMFYRGVARDAGILAWDMDRLLYNYNDHFVRVARDVAAFAGADQHAYPWNSIQAWLAPLPAALGGGVPENRALAILQAHYAINAQGREELARLMTSNAIKASRGERLDDEGTFAWRAIDKSAFPTSVEHMPSGTWHCGREGNPTHPQPWIVKVSWVAGVVGKLFFLRDEMYCADGSALGTLWCV